jgi:signal recognition particle subunit SRP54
MIPGVPKEMRNTEIDDRDIARIEGIIHSMTAQERRNPKLIDGSRRARIANGSGVTTADVNGLLNQFSEVQKMMRSLGGGALAKRKQKKQQKAKKGGRVTPKGPPAAAGKPPKVPFQLPGLN